MTQIRCSDLELMSLANAIVSSKLTTEMTTDEKPLILTIRKLKRYMSTDGEKLITWIYNTLKARKTTALQMTDPVNETLLNLMKDIIVFEEALNKSSALDALFNLIKQEVLSMVWLLCLMGEKLPEIVVRRIHEYLILGFASYGNQYLSTSISNNDQRNIVYTSNQLFTHMMNHQNTELKQVLLASVVSVLDQYIAMVKQNRSLNTNIEKYTLGYFLTLSKSSPFLLEESWSLIFRRLMDDDAAGSIFLYEKTNKYSLVRTGADKIEAVADLFPLWLSKIAFDPQGLIMKHAVDVAIMLDTLAHDPRLGLKHLVPTGDRSIIDTLKPSFEQLDLKQPSINLIQWALSLLCAKQKNRKTMSQQSQHTSRGVDDLKIPLFLLQLVILKDEVVKDTAIDMFVQLVTQLDRSEPKSFMGARYLILELLTSTEAKWPGIFQTVLDNIFSRAIAMHIADSAGAVNVEKILGNLAFLFEPSTSSPETVSSNMDIDGQEQPELTAGFQAFHTYMTTHWRQVTLLFLNHPSMECRAMGYRVMTNSKFWSPISNAEDIQTIAKLFVDAWFRNLKNRYRMYGQLQDDKVELYAIEEQQRLITHCCQNIELAKSILTLTVDNIVDGALEVFPTTDMNAVQQEKLSLLKRVQVADEVDSMQKQQQLHQPAMLATKKPPQFVTSISLLNQQGLIGQDFLTARDKLYADNIERTFALFYQFKDLSTMTLDGFMQVVTHILSHLCMKWSPNSVSLDTYDDVLPHKIPYQSDIVIGSAFKDHPVLFLIFEKYMAAIRQSNDKQLLHQFHINEIVRSVLIYLIVFWYMKDVVTVPTTLRFATQLEETTRLLLLMKPVLHESLAQVYQVFPFVSAKDIGDILHQVVWHYLRWHPATKNATHIPGLKAATAPLSSSALAATTQDDTSQDAEHELADKCMKKLNQICRKRLVVLENAPSWHQALKEIVDGFAVETKI